MSGVPHSFDRQSAQRIVRAVRHVEQRPPTEPRRLSGRHAYGQRRWKGKTDAAINKGDTGTVNLYSGDKGSETDISEAVEAYNTFANVGADKWVFVEFIDGGWELYVAECDDALISGLGASTTAGASTSTSASVAVYSPEDGETYQVSAANLFANLMADQIVVDADGEIVTAGGNVVVAGG